MLARYSVKLHIETSFIRIIMLNPHNDVRIIISTLRCNERFIIYIDVHT